MLTNGELAQAIVATQDRLRWLGSAYPERPVLVEHLKALLAEQLKRATLETVQQPRFVGRDLAAGPDKTVWYCSECGYGLAPCKHSRSQA
jgi:hypothetical protein